MKKTEVNKVAKRQIKLWWWNMGTKTLDFEGSYKDYFSKRNIKLTIIRHSAIENKKVLRFSFSVGRLVFKIDSSDIDIQNSFDMIVKIYQTYLGDKTLFHANSREYRINWR